MSRGCWPRSAGSELDRGPRIAGLSEFIEAELARHEEDGNDLPASRVPLEPLNSLFREALTEAWGTS
jgi:hypothetical protein